MLNRSIRVTFFGLFALILASSQAFAVKGSTPPDCNVLDSVALPGSISNPMKTTVVQIRADGLFSTLEIFNDSKQEAIYQQSYTLLKDILKNSTHIELVGQYPTSNPNSLAFQHIEGEDCNSPEFLNSGKLPALQKEIELANVLIRQELEKRLPDHVTEEPVGRFTLIPLQRIDNNGDGFYVPERIIELKPQNFMYEPKTNTFVLNSPF